MNSVIAAVDFSIATEAVLAKARDLARHENARVVVAHVFQAPLFLDPYSTLVDRSVYVDESMVRERLDRFCRQLEKAGLDTSLRLLHGNPGPALVDEARRINALFLVIGCQGHGALRHLMMGSTLQHVIKHSPCPVLVVPPHLTGGSAAAPAAAEKETGA